MESVFPVRVTQHATCAIRCLRPPGQDHGQEVGDDDTRDLRVIAANTPAITRNDTVLTARRSGHRPQSGRKAAAISSTQATRTALPVLQRIRRWIVSCNSVQACEPPAQDTGYGRR